MVFRVAAPRFESDHDHDQDVKQSNRLFDLMSHEIIEQRLENLKRKPKWTQWLDAYVHKLDRDGHDDDEWTPRGGTNVTAKGRETHGAKRSGFFSHVFWTIVGLVSMPFIVLFCVPFQRFYSPYMWPLGCHSPTSFLKQAVLNACTIVLIVAVAYWTLCDELPTRHMETNVALVRQHASILYLKLVHCAHNLRVSDDIASLKWLQAIVEGGSMASFEWPVTVPRECLGPILDALVMAAFLGLLLNFYSKWSRYAIFTFVLVQYTLSSPYVQTVWTPRPAITSLEPAYAMLDEPLVVTVEGDHLQPGGTVAWIPFWCAPSTYASSDAFFVGDCDKQFGAPFAAGVVHVTFTLVDTFIPCYKHPPNPVHPQVFECFDAFQIRVKTRQNIPGLYVKPNTITVELSADDTVVV
ncbi:hypothetical protein H257_13627 [Aphanomyces astaci]|uniref:Uncharacterized protein n=1 Tax=Aphanomyces astaci TaxID=112090 RepID=W4FTR1_APHAT|nr:hypothetical protein H257_13627 [Aphanomyces astaci]ETV70847.1 hypothetical protein H257_13627 [Aphanomyces astaci]RQM24477.1 hypothetical protein B5M09_002978 [Aphanomyces astaci]|eukprot:XP_009839510.1 hypothetical protein H257_13627 [Aphanomyces astaci]